jgi:aminomethyltransferase
MPVEYSGILKEHEAVRTSMGLFDVSHMGEIEVKGKRALDFCQRIATNDASQMKPGKVQYSAILNERGGVIDDCTLYRLAEEHFMFVVNASRKDAVFSWFEQHRMDGAKVDDRSDAYGLLALQGRSAEALMSNLAKRDLSTLKYYEFLWAELMDSAVLISRTGYTGEDGFELYAPSDKTGTIWDMILEAGSKGGLLPIGLGARDTLRLEMGYMLYGHEINEGTTPLEAGIGWAVKMDKGNFIGRERLLEQKAQGVRRRIRGVKMTDRGIPRSHYEVYAGADKKIGEVTSGTFSPTLKQGIALAMVDAGIAEGDTVSVKVREKLALAEVVRPPFVKGSVKK